MKLEDFSIALSTAKTTLELAKELMPDFGFIKRAEPIKYGNEFGFLVWDCILYNEITFIDGEKNQRLFSAFSHKQTKREFNRLLKQFKLQK